MDRLTREMAEISRATETGDSSQAGQSLGVKRKRIEKKVPTRKELNGIEGIPVRKRQKRGRDQASSSSRASRVPTTYPLSRSGSQEYPRHLTPGSNLNSGYSEHDSNEILQSAASPRRSLVSSGYDSERSLRPLTLPPSSSHLAYASEEEQKAAVSRSLLF